MIRKHHNAIQTTVNSKKFQRFHWRPTLREEVDRYRQKLLHQIDTEISFLESRGLSTEDAQATRQSIIEIGPDEFCEEYPRIEKDRQRDWESRLHEWGAVCIGSRYLDATLWNFTITNDQQAKAVEQIKAFAGDLPSRLSRGQNLVIAGGAGNGKDHLLSHLLKVVILGVEPIHEADVYWTNGVDILEVKPTRDHRHYLLAVSDPVLPGNDLKWQSLVRMYDVIDKQYRDRRPTWVTMNCSSRDHMEKMLSEPIADRLLHDAEVIFCDWESYRKGQGQAASIK